MIEFVVFFGLLLGACYWIINPLLQEDVRQNGFTLKPEDILEELKNKKDGAYAAIRELEFDLNMGKLTEEDFQVLKGQYTREAVGYMKEMDKLESPQAAFLKPVDTVVEEEIEPGVAEIHNPESTAGKHVYCTSCGEMAKVESRFCAACGASIDKHHKK